MKKKLIYNFNQKNWYYISLKSVNSKLLNLKIHIYNVYVFTFIIFISYLYIRYLLFTLVKITQFWTNLKLSEFYFKTRWEEALENARIYQTKLYSYKTQTCEAQLSIGAFPCRASLPRVDLLVYRRAGILIYPKESASCRLRSRRCMQKRPATIYAAAAPGNK